MAEGVNVGTAYVTIIPSAKDFVPKLKDEVGGGMDGVGKQAGTGFTAGFGSSIKAIGTTMAAMFAADKIVDFFGSAIDEARESQKVNALTEQIIKSTGGSAKITADQVGELAGRLSEKVGIDDEAIQSGANLLLTFKNVRNEVGEGNNVFDRATAAAVDLSAAGFGSIESASKMLGKALNDPVQGMTALSRAGVTFTDAQKKQVEAMVKSGDVLGAQKLIMAEVESQVGGAAAASATAADRLAVKWGNFKEQIGTNLLPVIDMAADAIGNGLTAASERLGPVLSTIGAGLQGLWDLVVGGDFTSVFADVFGVEEDAPIVSTILTIRDGLMGLYSLVVGGDFTGAFARAFAVEEDSPLVGQILAARQAVSDFASQAVPTLSAAADAILTTVMPAIAGFFTTIGPQVFGVLAPILTSIGTTITGTIIPAIMQLAPQIGAVLTTVVGLVTTIVSTILAAITPFVPTVMAMFATIGQIIAAAMALAVAVVTMAVNLIRAAWDAWGASLVSMLTTVFAAAMSIISAALNLIKAVISTVLAAIRGDWSGAWDGMKSILSAAWDLIKAVVTGALSILKASISAGWDVIKSLTSAAWEAIKAVLSAVWEGIKAAMSAAWEAMKSATSSAWEGIKSAVSSAAQAVVSALQSAWSSMSSIVSSAWSAVTSAVSSAWTQITSAVSSGISSMMALVQSIPGLVAGALGDLSGLLFNAGASIIRGLLNGIESMIGSVRSKLSELTSMIPQVKGPPDRDAELLYDNGRLIIAGLQRGLESQYGSVFSSLEGFTDDIAGTGSTFGAAQLATATPTLDQLATAANAMPRELVVRDVDGALIGRMRVESESVLSDAVADAALVGSWRAGK